MPGTLYASVLCRDPGEFVSPSWSDQCDLADDVNVYLAEPLFHLAPVPLPVLLRIFTAGESEAYDQGSKPPLEGFPPAIVFFIPAFDKEHIFFPSY